MGLFEDLNNEQNFPITRRAWCTVCELLNELPPKEKEALQLRMDNKNITHTALSAVLNNNGHPISDSTIGRHRRGRCNGATR